MRLYGCLLRDFSNKYISTLYTAWRKSYSHCMFTIWVTFNLFTLIMSRHKQKCQEMTVKMQLHNTILKFCYNYYKISSHNNTQVSLCHCHTLAISLFPSIIYIHWCSQLRTWQSRGKDWCIFYVEMFTGKLSYEVLNIFPPIYLSSHKFRMDLKTNYVYIFPYCGLKLE